MLRTFVITVGLICLAHNFGSEAAQCKYPDQWSTEGYAFGPVRYFTNTPDCLKSTIFVHYPSKSMQIRNIQSGEENMETGLWVFRDGNEGVSVNIPLFGRQHINYTEHDRKQGKCDVMTFQTRDKEPMAGAIELHQELDDLHPVLAKDGTVLYYEQNFTSTQVLETSLKIHQRRGHDNDISGTSNYLYSTFIHRVKIRDGQCVPLSYLRTVFFGSSCSWYSFQQSEPAKVKRTPAWVEYLFAADENAYKPGEIGKFDRSVPQLSCSNDFDSLEEVKEKINGAYDGGICPTNDILDKYINTCCDLDYQTYTATETCKIFSKYHLFQPYEQVQSTVCSKRKSFETGRGKIYYVDDHCIKSHPEFKFW